MDWWVSEEESKEKTHRLHKTEETEHLTEDLTEDLKTLLDKDSEDTED